MIQQWCIRHYPIHLQSLTPMESHPEIVFYLSFRLLIAFFLVGLFLFLLRRMIDRKRTVNLSLSFLSSVRANNEHGECILFRNVFTVRLDWFRRAHLFNRYFLLISRILLPYFLLVGCCFVVVFTTFHICSHECDQCWYQPGQSCHTRTELNSRMGGGLMHIRVGR